MADASEDKRDEEQVVSDDDANTRDVGEEDKRDEEQVVSDDDANTRDVDSRLDAIEDTLQRIGGTLRKLADAQAAMVGSGAIIDVDDSDPSDDDGMGEGASDVLDLSIDDLD